MVITDQEITEAHVQVSVLGTPFGCVCWLRTLLSQPHCNHQPLTACMAPKCKHNEDVQTLSFAHNELSDSEELVQATQTNIIMHAGHDAQGHPSIHTMHTAYVDEELPDLTSIYGALNNDVQSQTQSYGDEDFVVLLEDDSSPSFHKHQVPEGIEGCSTVSSSQFVFQCIANHSWSQSCPIQEWLQYQQEFIDEFIHLDSLGEQGQLVACIHCGENDGTVRCGDCFGQGLYCTNCIVMSHVFLPLHRLSMNFLLYSHLAGFNDLILFTSVLEWHILWRQ